MKKNLAKIKAAEPARINLSFDLMVEIFFLAMIFITPVIFDRRLGIVFSGTKIAWLRGLMVMTLSIWAIKLVVTGKHRFVRTPLDWPVISYLFSATIATIASVHFYTSFTGFYGRFEGLSTWYVFGLLFFVTINYVRSFEQLKRIIITVVSAATLMSIYGVIQRQELDPYMWGGVVTWLRVIGTIGQPNFQAAYILMAFFLALILFLEKRKRNVEIDWFQQLPPLGYFVFGQMAFIVMIYSLEAQNVLLWYFGWGLITAAALLFAYTYEKLHPLILEILLGISMILIYVCLLYTQSRGGYIGFFVGAVLFAIVAGRNWIFGSWKKISLLGILILVISAFTMLSPGYSPLERFTSEIKVKSTEQEQTQSQETAGGQLELSGAAGSRGETWKSAFKIIADYPVFGIGPEVLKMVFPRYETELFRYKEAFHVKQDRCHNETFDVPVTKGMVTFFIYLWLLFVVFKTGFAKLKKANEQQKLMLAGLLAGIVAYLVQNQFSFGVVAITSLFWVMWGMVMVLGEESDTETHPIAAEDIRSLDWKDIPWLPMAAIAIAAVFLVYISFLSFRSDIYFKSGKTNLEARNLPGATEELSKSLKVFPFEGNTISHLGITYLNQGKADDAINVLKYGTLVDPYNADNFYMLCKVFMNLYDRGMKAALPESDRYADNALKIDPYYAEVYEAKGMIYEREGKVAEAENMYERSFHVNPFQPGPIQKIKELSQKLGQTEKAKKIFGEAAARFPTNIELFKVMESYK